MMFYKMANTVFIIRNIRFSFIKWPFVCNIYYEHGHFECQFEAQTHFDRYSATIWRASALVALRTSGNSFRQSAVERRREIWIHAYSSQRWGNAPQIIAHHILGNKFWINLGSRSKVLRWHCVLPDTSDIGSSSDPAPADDDLRKKNMDSYQYF
jgi:hypothetical protein